MKFHRNLKYYEIITPSIFKVSIVRIISAIKCERYFMLLKVFNFIKLALLLYILKNNISIYHSVVLFSRGQLILSFLILDIHKKINLY
jgi:hypothetical protein